MNEIYEKMKKEIEETKVPESLDPKNLDKLLEKGHEKTDDDFNSYKIKRSNKKYIAVAVASAALALIIIRIPKINKGPEEPIIDQKVAVKSDEGEEIVRTNAGSLYHVAETEDALKKYWDDYNGQMYFFEEDNLGVTTGAMNKEVAPADGGTLDSSKSTNSGMAREEASAASTDYTKTNLQVENVDESDIVKTDGKYIYTISHNSIIITEVSGEEMNQITRIQAPSVQSSNSDFREIYLDKNRLYVVASVNTVSLLKNRFGRRLEDNYYYDNESFTYIYTYDISDIKNPKLAGTFSQSGSYNTSRLVGGILYLFTNRYVNSPDYIHPLIKDKELDADSIYLPYMPANSQLVVSSIDVKKPGKAIDSIAVLNYSENIHMTEKAFYIVSTAYETDGDRTNIARFTLNKGIINAGGAATVRGYMSDTFSIHEGKDYFGILTTDFNRRGDTSNTLNLFNFDMENTGTISDIAPGETIYAARYIGDYVYFITFRQTDPLFVADISDIHNPVLTGAVEITGFSDYLHPWGKNRLLGIGYEIEEKTGIRVGTKIVMFDTTDPKEPKILGYFVVPWNHLFEGDNYKSILASPEKNMIGFGTYSGETNDASYLTFEWDEERKTFIPDKTMKMASSYYPEFMRGIGIGDTLYVVTDKKIITGNGTEKVFD